MKARSVENMDTTCAMRRDGNTFIVLLDPVSNIVPHRFFLLVMASGRGPLSLCCCFCCCRFRSLHRYYLHCSKPEFTSVPPYGFSLLCNERITDLLCKHLEILPLKFRDMPDNTINKTRPPPPPNKLFI